MSSPFPTPLPKRQVAVLWFLQLSEPVANSVIYPFVNELVKSLPITGGDPKRVGYYVGIIESSFFFVECLCVLHWGRLSDIVGRKPVILVGLCGFWLLQAFAMLVFSRCLAGLTNGNIGVIKSAIGEISDSTNVALAFKYMPLCWPLGETIGPLIGGYLSNPANRYPGTFDTAFWLANPYLLPCIVAAIFPAIGAVITAMFFQETHPNPHTIKALYRSRRAVSDPESRPLLPHSESFHVHQSFRSVFTPRVLITVVNYCMLALVNIGYSVLQPLFLSTPIELGGLGLGPDAIGKILGAQGIGSALVLLLLSSKLQGKFGVKRTFSLAMVSFLINFACFPVINSVARLAQEQPEVRWMVWAVVALQITCFTVVTIAYGCIFVMITNAAPSKSLLGCTNGLAQTAASLMRAIGPAGATALFAVSVDKTLLLEDGPVSIHR
ncbi:major facilitator superfamily domain-containing protein [Cantharellus anzutake]|uniref:major facilitator superfamily domain-containing protein n=1 Tax=Cantharellus anzutake TaxID=1750568 RepID=UPI0019040483|nr:major facilitator superfamily domain-containing protein [Cantharellus anzutake]KAF8335061.1 major facilitator superfamily domain-containing protein [Cantharellus anzutake]